MKVRSWPPWPVSLASMTRTRFLCSLGESLYRGGTKETGRPGGEFPSLCVRLPWLRSGADLLKEAEAGLSTVKQAIQIAVSQLGLDAAPVKAAPSRAFFKHAPQPPSFRVPPSEPYNEKLQRCWSDPKAFIQLPSDCRALAAMKDVPKMAWIRCLRLMLPLSL